MITRRRTPRRVDPDRSGARQPRVASGQFAIDARGDGDRGAPAGHCATRYEQDSRNRNRSVARRRTAQADTLSERSAARMETRALHWPLGKGSRSRLPQEHGNGVSVRSAPQHRHAGGAQRARPGDVRVVASARHDKLCWPSSVRRAGCSDAASRAGTASSHGDGGRHVRRDGRRVSERVHTAGAQIDAAAVVSDRGPHVGAMLADELSNRVSRLAVLESTRHLNLDRRRRSQTHGVCAILSALAHGLRRPTR